MDRQQKPLLSPQQLAELEEDVQEDGAPAVQIDCGPRPKDKADDLVRTVIRKRRSDGRT